MKRADQNDKTGGEECMQILVGSNLAWDWTKYLSFTSGPFFHGNWIHCFGKSPHFWPQVSEHARRWAGKTVDEITLPEDFTPPKRRCLNPMAPKIRMFRTNLLCKWRFWYICWKFRLMFQPIKTMFQVMIHNQKHQMNLVISIYSWWVNCLQPLYPRLPWSMAFATQRLMEEVTACCATDNWSPCCATWSSVSGLQMAMKCHMKSCS